MGSDCLQPPQNIWFNHFPVWPLLHENCLWFPFGVEIANRAVNEENVLAEEVFQAAAIASFDIRPRDVVAAMADALGDAAARHFNARQRQV